MGMQAAHWSRTYPLHLQKLRCHVGMKWVRGLANFDMHRLVGGPRGPDILALPLPSSTMS